MDYIISFLLWFITKLHGIIKFVGKWIFSKQEKELLIAAAQSGIIVTISTNQYGRFVRAGDKDFPDISDPAIAATYLEALESLYKKKLVYPESDVYYNLTSSGFKIARKLAKRMRPDCNG